jgi:proline utilization trans-activator
VEELLRENERLRNESSAAVSHTGISRQALIAEDQETVQNPLVEDRPQGWFFPMSSLDMPIHISEAADAAFATRFREALTPHSVHIPRTSYARDDALIMLSESHFDWPSPARARFLVKVALSTVCQYYHIVLKSTIMNALEKAVKNVNDVDRLTRCKLLALFALGEVYSSRVAAQEATASKENGQYPSRTADIARSRNRSSSCTVLLQLEPQTHGILARKFGCPAGYCDGPQSQRA